MVQMRNTPGNSFTNIPDNQGVTYEEIRAILWRRHDTDRIGDNDTM